MGETDRGEILRAQQAEGAEHVLMLEGAPRIDLHQRHHQQVDDPAGIDVRGVERRLDLGLHLEAPGDAGQHRVGLAPPIRHRLQQGGDETQGGVAPEIGEAEHVQGHEPAAAAPDLPPELADQVGLADPRGPDQNPPQDPVGRRLRLGVEVGDDRGHQGLVGPAGRLRVDPDAVEGAHPVEIDPPQGVEGIGHDWIQMRWNGSPAGL